MSLRALAARAGISAGQLSKFERGELPEMGIGSFFDACAALGVDPSEIWWGSGPREPIAAKAKSAASGTKRRRV